MGYRFRCLFLILMMFFVFPSACSGQEKKTDGVWLINPGKTVGWVKIGFNDIRTIERHFGKKGQWMKEKGALSYRRDYGLDFIYDRQTMTVTSVLVTVGTSGGVRYTTTLGVHVDSPVTDMIKAYGDKSIKDKIKDYDIYTYKVKDGFISFAVFKNRVVTIWTGLGTDYDKHGTTIREIVEQEKQ